MDENNKTETKDRLFRESSLKRISSPEDLNDYVRVANPGVWMTLAAIVILLVGFIVWGSMGNIYTVVPAVMITDDGHTDCYIAEEDTEYVKAGMEVSCNGESYKVKSIADFAVDSRDVLSDYSKHTLGISEGEWVRPIEIDGTPKDGINLAYVVIETVKPISFILN